MPFRCRAGAKPHILQSGLELFTQHKSHTHKRYLDPMSNSSEFLQTDEHGAKAMKCAPLHHIKPSSLDNLPKRAGKIDSLRASTNIHWEVTLIQGLFGLMGLSQPALEAYTFTPSLWTCLSALFKVTEPVNSREDLKPSLQAPALHLTDISSFPCH